MITIKLTQLDYRYILIDQYRELGLTENEVIVLLLVDTIYKNKPSLITGELLSSKMTLKSEEIDKILVSLMDKHFLSYEDVNGIMVTSMENTYKKIIDLFKKNVTSINDLENDKSQSDSYSRVLKRITEEMKRNLSSLELDLINTWFNGENMITEQQINFAIDECLMKNNKITVKQIDRIIIKNLSHKDVIDEGFTSVDDKTKRDIKKAIDIASYDWQNRQ